MEAASHIIGKQRIHLHYNGATDTIALRQLISKVCSDELPVRLSQLLDRYDDKDFVFRIDRLDVHVKIDDDGNLEETLAKVIVEQIEEALRRRLEQRAQQSLPVSQGFAQTLQYYLKNGFLPWWSLIKDVPAFHHALRQAWDLPDSLQEIIREISPGLSSKDARQRLLDLLTPEQLNVLVAGTQIMSHTDLALWLDAFHRIRHGLPPPSFGEAADRLVYDAILSVLAGQPKADKAPLLIAEAIAKRIRRLGLQLTESVIASLPSSGIRLAVASQLDQIPQGKPAQLKQEGLVIGQLPQESKEKSEDESAELREGASIFINNAGLVLIAAYLPSFFRNMGLLQDGHLLKKDRAIAFLREIVFADDGFEEFEVVLEKILCGIRPWESIETRHSLTTEERAHTHDLMQSVIEHWSVLKKTSADGLRHNFLQREGKLIFQRDQWELTVQKQAHDLLLDYIPWNFRMIRLPWMPELLTVNWNN